MSNQTRLLIETHQRDTAIDVLKGVGILLMVLDHIRLNSLSHILISSFHMPLFFLASGYLFHDTQLGTFLKKRLHSLGIPYLVWGLFFCLLSLLLFGFTSRNLRYYLIGLIAFPTTLKRLPLSAPLWFLPCIFLTEFIYLCLHSVSVRKPSLLIQDVTPPFLCLAGIIYAKLKLPILPFSIAPALVAIFFYWIGTLLKRGQYVSHLLNLNLSEAIILATLGVFCAFFNGVTDLRSTSYKIPYLFLLTGIVHTVVVWNAAKYISQTICLKILCNMLSYVGRNSMIYLCLNYSLAKAVNFILNLCSLQNTYMLVLGKLLGFIVIVCAMTIICHLALKTRFSYVFGKPCKS